MDQATQQQIIKGRLAQAEADAYNIALNVEQFEAQAKVSKGEVQAQLEARIDEEKASLARTKATVKLFEDKVRN